MSVLAFLAAAHHHRHGWTSAQIAAVAFALIAAGAILAVGLILARWWVSRSSRKRKPCPGCGTFLAPGERCQVCPPAGNGGTVEEAERNAPTA